MKKKGKCNVVKAIYSISLRRKYFLMMLFYFGLFLTTTITAQDFYSNIKQPPEYLKITPDFYNQMTIMQAVSPADTILHPKVKLLPDNISFGEKLFWGENGIFRSLGLASPLTIESRKSELSLRRGMLTAHMIGGFTTLGLMYATVFVGQKMIDGRRDLLPTHQTLVLATVVSYSLTGLLSILSPPPLIRRDDDSGTITIHKILAWIHVAGMIITPILGSLIAQHRNYNETMARVHQISAYFTTAVFTAAMIVITF